MQSIGSYPLNQVIVGDSRELAKSIPDESIDMIFTDPIYPNKDDYIWLANLALRILKPAGVLLCWSNGKWHYENAKWLESVGLTYRWEFSHLWHTGAAMVGKIIWKTNRILWFDKNGNSEMLDYFIDGYFTKQWSPINSHNHKWTKDLRYCGKAVIAFSPEDSVVYDPFCGGATIPAACKKNGRNFIASEIEQEAVVASSKRLSSVYYEPMMALAKPNKASTRQGRAEAQFEGFE